MVWGSGCRRVQEHAVMLEAERAHDRLLCVESGDVNLETLEIWTQGL